MLYRTTVVSEFGGKDFNLVLARAYCKFVKDQGRAPYAAHLINPQFLDENNPVERQLGMDIGKEFIRCCDDVWVFVREGKISAGMKEEIKFAIKHQIPVAYFCADDLNNIVRLNHIGEAELPTAMQLVPVSEAKSVKVTATFTNIAIALQNGASYDIFEASLNGLLGTEMEERDLEAEETYELRNRRKDDD